MSVRLDTPEQTDRRLRRIARLVSLHVLDGEWWYDELQEPERTSRVRANALALVREGQVWSQLVPVVEGDRPAERLRVWCCHFPTHRGDRRLNARRAEVFFYGLFMDVDLLRAMGLEPEGFELATVDGYTLRIGERAALVPSFAGRVHGVVVSLTLAELDRLYEAPDLSAYRPEALLARLESGGTIAALCYNLPTAPMADERNLEYAGKLRAVARKIGLPPAYIDSLR